MVASVTSNGIYYKGMRKGNVCGTGIPRDVVMPAYSSFFTNGRGRNL